MKDFWKETVKEGNYRRLKKKPEKWKRKEFSKESLQEEVLWSFFARM